MISIKRPLSKIIGNLFRSIFFLYSKILRVKNFNKPKLLFYTDSRGYLIGNIFSYKNGFINPLVRFLETNFNLEYSINKHKHTTYFDFLKDYSDQKLEDYVFIVLILGAVDFSPRNFQDAESLRRKKVSDLGVKLDHTSSFLDKKAIFEEEFTDSIVNNSNLKFLEDRLKKFSDKLIVVSTGFVNDDWRGSYWRDRPKNINEFFKREKYFAKKISKNLIDLSDQDPKKISLDNIHFSPFGFNLIKDKIKEIIL